jgi:hypothetical protein
MTEPRKDDKPTENVHPGRGLMRSFRDHPAMSLAGFILIAAVLHRQVTGEPLGASLTSPVDWIVIALMVLAFGLAATAVYSFLPAIVTGAIVRSQKSADSAIVSSGPWFAVVAGLYAAVLSGLVLFEVDPREHLLVYLCVVLVGAFAAVVPVFAPQRLRSTVVWLVQAPTGYVWRLVQELAARAFEKWPRLVGAFRRYRVPFAILLVWLLVTGVVVVVSTFTLASVAGKSEVMADESATVVTIFLSAVLGVVVAYSALVARKNDGAYVASLAFFAIAVVAVMGAMPPIYSFSLRAAGTGQYTMQTMWFNAESCEIVKSLPGLKVSDGSADRCFAENVFVVSLSDSLVVIAASQEAAKAGCRARLPRASFLGGLKGPDVAETTKGGNEPAPIQACQ